MELSEQLASELSSGCLQLILLLFSACFSGCLLLVALVFSIFFHHDSSYFSLLFKERSTLSNFQFSNGRQYIRSP